MDNLTYGHVCFAFTKNSFIASSIAKVTGSKWSHTFITTPPILGKEMVMESAKGGISMIELDGTYRGNPSQIYELYKFKIDQAIIDSAILSVMSTLENPYPFLQYAWFIWRWLNLKILKKDIKNRDNWYSKNDVCSGMVRLFIESAGYKNLYEGFGIDAANAEDGYKIVKNHPELFELVEFQS